MGAKIQELAKRTGLKINLQNKNAGIPTRFAQGVSEETLRKEQRKRDAAAGLVPFACKLPMDVISAVNARAAQDGAEVSAVVQAALAKYLKVK
jgi:hypothetical protein